MAIDTDLAPRADGDPRNLRFFPAGPKAARTLSAAQIEEFDRDGLFSQLPFDGNPVADVS